MVLDKMDKKAGEDVGSEDHSRLEEWFQLIRRKTSEIPVQKSAELGTAKIPSRTLQAAGRGPDV